MPGQPALEDSKTANDPNGGKPAGPSAAAILGDVGWRILAVAGVIGLLLGVLYFPRSSDAPLTEAEQKALQKYYLTAYDKPVETKEDTRYEEIARSAADSSGVIEAMNGFARDFGLSGKRVLDIGAGRGYLQDVVADYTGLDISPSVKRYFHKPFVVGSATLLPFGTDEFDAAWTIWVLEHVQNPEAALAEMRRVVKDGGLLYLAPAWDVRPWQAQGYPVRPYANFGLGGKVYKASIPVQAYFGNVAKLPVHLARYAALQVGGPMKFRYRLLSPNYDYYWMADSDAVNSLDRYETALWFLSRGDECLNCDGALNGLLHDNAPLIVRVHKPHVVTASR